jgi:hypothetical protein
VLFVTAIQKAAEAENPGFGSVRSRLSGAHRLAPAWCRDQRCERNGPNPFRGQTMRT